MADREWLARMDRHKRFMATELGQLYAAYSKATIDYWRHDSDEAFSTAKLKALNEVYFEKQQAFVAKLMELAGV